MKGDNDRLTVTMTRSRMRRALAFIEDEQFAEPEEPDWNESDPVFRALADLRDKMRAALAKDRNG